MEKKPSKFNVVSFTIISFIVSGILVVIGGILIGLLDHDTYALVFGVLFGLFFALIGLIAPYIVKQNSYVAAIMLFCFFDAYIVITTIIIAIFLPFDAMWILSLLAGVFFIVIILSTLYTKKIGKLKLYKAAEVKMQMPVAEVLNNAINDLVKEGEPWEITTEGNSIIARINWKNTTNLSLDGITKEVQNFEYRVNLFDDYKYTEGTESTSDTASIGPGGASMEHGKFYGLELKDVRTIEFGVNHNTGEEGIIKTNFSTDEIRDRVRQYVEERGYKRTLF